MGKITQRFSVSDVISMIIVMCLALVCLFPFYWALISSLKTELAIFSIPPEWWPKAPSITAYTNLIARTSLITWTTNSFIVAITTVALICLFATMSGYAFAHIPFTGKKLLFITVVATMLLPKYVMLVPLYKLIEKLGWFNTYHGMIIPEVASALPFSIFLIRQFMSGIPKEIFESATIDGCNRPQSFILVAVPLSKPAIASLSILMFVRAWNDYMWQLIVVSKDFMRTLPLGLASLQTENTKIFSQVMAGAIVSAIPLLIVFIAFQKFFIRGLASGAVKE